MRRFDPGTTIAWRSVDRVKQVAQTALPWIVVRHDERSIVLYLPLGTAWTVRTDRHGGPRNRILLVSGPATRPSASGITPAS